MTRRSLVLAAGVAWLVVGFALLPAPPVHAQEQGNCPDGFTWERMSGQCCVQDRSTIPPHGKIGYTGNSFCEDGWYDVFDRRPTTDGQGPPGCPGYTSFVFLVDCASSPEAAKEEQAKIDAAVNNPLAPPPANTNTNGNAGGSGLNALSDALFAGGNMPSASDLALSGGILATILGVVGASTLRGSGGAVVGQRTRDLLNRLKSEQREIDRAQQAADKAVKERDAIERQRSDLRRMASQLEQRLNDLEKGLAQCDYNLGVANDAKFVLSGLGLVAAIVSFAAWAAAVPAATAAAAEAPGAAVVVDEFLGVLNGVAARIVSGLGDITTAFLKLGVSTETFGGGLMAHFRWSGPWQRMKADINSLTANTSFLKGRVQGQIDDLNRAYEQADARAKDAMANLERARGEADQISQQIADP